MIANLVIKIAKGTKENLKYHLNCFEQNTASKIAVQLTQNVMSPFDPD